MPSGGIEQNGPHMIVGKHDYIVRAAARRIASELGQTLVAPVVSYVPEGSYDPPSGHMRFPGTLGFPEPVFAATLEGIARSLKAGGFKTIGFIADHGGSQAPQAEVAAKLNAEWAGKGIRVISVDAYYADAEQIALLERQGESRSGHRPARQHHRHVGADGGASRRRRSRPACGFTLQSNGVVGDPRTASADRGKELLAHQESRRRSRQIRSQPAR